MSKRHFHRRPQDSKPFLLRSWSDLCFSHGLDPAKNGERYPFFPPARCTVFGRLFSLNHKRYAEEINAGLHDKSAKKCKAKKVKYGGSAAQGDLIKPPQQELFK